MRKAYNEDAAEWMAYRALHALVTYHRFRVQGLGFFPAAIVKPSGLSSTLRMDSWTPRQCRLASIRGGFSSSCVRRQVEFLDPEPSSAW